MPINARAKNKTPLPNAILKNKEFLRMVDVLVDCRSFDSKTARRAQDAAVEIAAGSVGKLCIPHRNICIMSDASTKAGFKKFDVHGVAKLASDSSARLVKFAGAPVPSPRKHAKLKMKARPW